MAHAPNRGGELFMANKGSDARTSRDTNQANPAEVKQYSGTGNPVGANRSSGGGLPKQPAEPPHTLEQAKPGEPANHWAGNKR